MLSGASLCSFILALGLVQNMMDNARKRERQNALINN